VGPSRALAGGPTLDGAFISHLFEGAEEAVFLIVTIGEALEAMVSELFAEGESVDAVVLDAVGSASIMAVFSDALTRVWQETADRGWVTDTCLRLGQSYWDIMGQQSIFQVISGENIGVSLLDSSFMRPQKSQSAVVPIGPDMKVHGDPNESYCRYCQGTPARCGRSRRSSWHDPRSPKLGSQWWCSKPSPTALNALMISSCADGLCSAQARTSPKDPASIMDPWGVAK